MCDVLMQAQVNREMPAVLRSENILDKKLLADQHRDVTTPKNISLYYSVTENDSTEIQCNGVEWIQISHYGVQWWVFVTTN
jgi:hypothetical protein